MGLAKASGASASSGLTKAAEESGNNGKEQKGLAKASTPAPPTPASEVDYGGSTSEPESHQPKKEKKKEDKKAALTKGEAPLSLTCKPNKKVAVDWHGVLVIDDFYKPSNNFFLQKLHKAGFEVHCLSFCGYKRAQEVWNWAWHEWENWASVSFTWKPCGEDGKTEWCLNHDITMLVDDRGDICSEAAKNGIEIFPVQPDTSSRKKKHFFNQVFANFEAVVEEILSRNLWSWQKIDNTLTKGCTHQSPESKDLDKRETLPKGEPSHSPCALTKGTCKFLYRFCWHPWQKVCLFVFEA